MDRSGCGYVYSNPLSYAFNSNQGHLLAFYVWQPEDVSGAARFRGAEITYQRKIAPAPATATFSDVPVGHALHQFVEALAASAITAGCGEDMFCPDAPLTRGQMAVFLAKALGLHWPN